MEKKRSRDNFTQQVLKILYRRAGGKCCRCAAATFGPVKNQPLQSVNIGKGITVDTPLSLFECPCSMPQEPTSLLQHQEDPAMTPG